MIDQKKEEKESTGYKIKAIIKKLGAGLFCLKRESKWWIKVLGSIGNLYEMGVCSDQIKPFNQGQCQSTEFSFYWPLTIYKALRLLIYYWPFYEYQTVIRDNSWLRSFKKLFSLLVVLLLHWNFQVTKITLNNHHWCTIF